MKTIRLKNILVLYFLLMVNAQPVLSQNTSSSHRILPGSKLKKQQVTFQATEETGEGVLWDFSNLELSKTHHVVKYSAFNGNDSIISLIEHGTRQYYQSTSTELMLYRYENSATSVNYDRPELMLHMPIVYGDRRQSAFHGSAVHGDRVFMRQYGMSVVVVDATGCMFLPTGDTLRHVSRVHIKELTAEQHFPHITSEEELSLMVDSIAPFTEDSILQHLAADSILTETNIYRWYAAGYRYPILEMTAVGPKGCQPSYTSGNYCSPEEQAEPGDEENEQVRKWLAAANHINNGNGAKNNTSDNSTVSNTPIEHVSVSVSGSRVCISYDLSADATVTAMMCNVQGMVLRQSSRHDQSGCGHQLEVSCAGLSHGQYVLYLNVNGEVTSYTINIG